MRRRNHLTAPTLILHATAAIAEADGASFLSALSNLPSKGNLTNVADGRSLISGVRAQWLI